MEADRWQQIDSVFEAALELSPAEWPAYLEEVCGDDDELRGEIESLLVAHLEAEGFIEESPFAVAAELLESDKVSRMLGNRLGRYQIERLLGSGGMGDVYLANDTQLNRPVALKLLPLPFTADRERLHRFEREARSASALNHPNILTIYEIGQEDSNRFIATEFIEGETLRERLKRTSLSLQEALDISIQIASALTAAHQAGIIHRDIKPDNLMLRQDGYIKVLDFGLAKLTRNQRALPDHSESATYRTSPGRVMGTIHYMSPEQARGLAVDERTDIWSLGVVLYELIAGRAPFTGETDSDVMAKILEREPPPLSQLAPSIPAELERIVTRSLSKEKSARYQSIEQFGADLKNFRQRLNLDASLARTRLREDFERDDANTTDGAHDDAEPDRNFITLPLPQSSPISPPNNLSPLSQPLIGRKQEVAEIEKLLLGSKVRLLTLTGVGGTGKTRLAQQIAANLLREFSDGIFFIELAAVSDAELVASTILQPLGAQQGGGAATPAETLKRHLHEKEMLLVLDNFEQALAASQLIADLLASAPKLKILVTSRAILHLSIEREFLVTPLSLPQSTHRHAASELMDYGATALFVERARTIKPTFTLSEETAPLVLEICRKLDGLPLAIELAAPRVKLLSTQAILTRLENSLNLLTGGAKDLPTRQQTMRGAIAWSYDLLESEEQTLLKRLAIFAGGCTIEAAEAVCGRLNQSSIDLIQIEERQPAATDLEIEDTDFPMQTSEMSVLDGISSLLDKSLLVQKEKADGESRFRMLEVVREFALERLKESGQAEAARRRHGEFFLSFAEELEPFLLGTRQTELLDKLEEEHDNLRAALRWLMQHDGEAFARLAGSLCDFWQIREHFAAEGRAWLAAALEVTQGEVTLTRAKALHAASALTRSSGDVESARNYLEECLAISKQIDDKFFIIRASNGLGAAAWQQDDLTLARPFFEEALAVSRELGDARMIGVALGNLGATAFGLGDYKTARALHEESLEAATKAGNKQSAAVTLANLGEVAFVEGDFAASRNYYTKALVLAQELSNWRTIGTALDGLSTVAAKTGAWLRAVQLAGAADALRETIKFELTQSIRHSREEFLAGLRREMGEGAFARAEAEGQTMPLEQAIVLAFSHP